MFYMLTYMAAISINRQFFDTHKGGLFNIEFLTSLTVASILWRPAPCSGWGWESGDDVDILPLQHRHYSFMLNCFFETLFIQLMAYLYPPCALLLAWDNCTNFEFFSFCESTRICLRGKPNYQTHDVILVRSEIQVWWCNVTLSR